MRVEHITKKSIDNKIIMGVPSSYLLNTGIYGTAPVSIAVFLRPAHGKGAGMDREYIEYLSQPYMRCVEHPGTLPNLFNRSIL